MLTWLWRVRLKCCKLLKQEEELSFIVFTTRMIIQGHAFGDHWKAVGGCIFQTPDIRTNSQRKWWKLPNYRFYRPRQPHCRLTPPAREFPANIRIYIRFLKLESSAYILPLIIWICLLSNSSNGLRNFFISTRVTFRPFKVIQGQDRKRVFDFLLVRHSNLGPILQYRRYCRVFLCSWPHPYSTLILGVFPLDQIADVRVSPSVSLRLIAVKLSSKYSNLCEKHTWTSQTVGWKDGQMDRWTDRRLWHNRALRSIAR